METWLPVPGHENYEVSDHGRVRSVDRIVSRSMKRAGQERFDSPMSIRGKMLRPWLVQSKPNWSGVLLVGIDGRIRQVGHLVLEAFVEPRPPGMEMCHRDDDALNNELSNLYWGTSSQNKRDLVQNGRHIGARKTHCKRAHPLSGDGSSVYLKKDGGRQCRTCRNEARQSR